MKTSKGKMLTIPLILMLTFAVLMAGMASVKAAEVPTYAFIEVAPNPVGVNQQVSVMFWLGSAPPTAAGPAGDRWEGMTVKITKPDGSTETKGPYRSDAVGGAYFTYKPTTTGTYKFQFSFPGQTIAGVYYKPSQSRVVELVVQTEPIEAWPDIPLPTSYWTRPINAELREWYKIAGNWLMPAYNSPYRPFDAGSAFNPYTTAPESPHVLWTKELDFGGIVGGELGYGANYYTGMSYEMKFTPPTIMYGRLYYNIFGLGGFMGVNLPGVVCVDLRTGEEIWRKEDMPQINFGQIFDYESPNQHGAQPYLWSCTTTDWKMFDAFTGALLVTLENATSTVGGFSTNVVFGPHGELLVYSISGANNRFIMWNSTKAITERWNLIFGGAGIMTATLRWMWRPGFPGFTELDWRDGIQLNVSIPDVPGQQSLSFVDYEDGVVLAESVLPGDPYPTFVHIGYNATTGTELWRQNRTNYGFGFAGPALPSLLWLNNPLPREGVYAFFQKETMQWHVFDVKTGNKRFSTNPLSEFTKTDWSMYDWPAVLAYGKLIVAGYSGCVTAFDLKTGEHLWTFDSGPSGLETPYGKWPFYGGITVADGKIYVANGEHSPGTPMWRGEKLYSLNATTGEKIWDISGWFIGNSIAIAEGYLVGYSGYDNRIYCFGKGKTQTTMTVTQDVVPKGSAILIKGSVNDLSPAVADTPAVADENMTSWMEYLVQQKPMPEVVAGVNVELYAIDEAGKTSYIDTVCTDPLNGGVFRKLWTPPEEGTYIIAAVFGGSKSYWPSYSFTAVGVTAAPTAPEFPEIPTPTDYTPYLLALTVAIIVVAILVIYALYTIRTLKK
ncbi:MAG: PQQ-binding-like beta-propeller repeat protein [Candidatus Bathyarchaeia archaeon]